MLAVWDNRGEPPGTVSTKLDYRKSGFSSRNLRPTHPQQPVPLHTLSAPGCSRSKETNSDHQYSADISAMFDRPRKVQVKNTHTFPSGSSGSSSPMFGSSWTVHHLWDEKEVVVSRLFVEVLCVFCGSYLWIYGDFCVFVEVFCVYVEVCTYFVSLWRFWLSVEVLCHCRGFEYHCGGFEYHCGGFVCHCGGFLWICEVLLSFYVYLWFCVSLWRFLVFVGDFECICGSFVFLWKFRIYLWRFWVYL